MVISFLLDRNLYIRQTKKDSKDSFIIAEVIRFGRFSSTCLAEEDILALINLSRFKLFQVDLVSDLKRKVISLLDQVFSEYSKLFADTFSFQIKQLIEQIKFIEEHITELEEEIALLLRKLDTPIETIPGIGPVLGAIILSEIGDIYRFKDASKLVFCRDRSNCKAIR